MLKKCGLDKKPLPPAKHHPHRPSVSDSEPDTLRTRNNSTSESVADANEVGGDTPQHVSSAATTPLTPTVKGDPLPNTGIPQLFRYSILNVETPKSSSEGVGSGFGSPVFPAPCTPSSIDSGISIRTHSAMLSPSDVRMKKHPPLSAAFSTTLPPLPPEESAPPLPPQDVEAPPPLPPLPPAPGAGEDQVASEGIENISSDEDDDKTKPPLSSLPIFPSPSSSSPLANATSSNHTFDPSLGLKNMLIDRVKAASDDSSKIPSSGPYAVSSPKPAYELEVEEISGDESPVMVYFEPLKVESISDDDDVGGGGDDMEISDNENEQDNVIELNVKTAAVPVMDPRPPHPMPHPSYPNMGIPIPGYFPSHLPHPMGAFPPIPPTHHPYPPGFSHHSMFPPAGRSSSPAHSRRGRDDPRRHHDTSSPGPFIKDSQVSRPPNGYIDSSYHSRSYSKSKVLRNFPSPKSKTESISQDVMFKAMEQLRLILLNDVHKKIVENSAYPLLDGYWKKKEEEVRVCCLSLYLSSLPPSFPYLPNPSLPSPPLPPSSPPSLHPSLPY